MKCNVMEAKVVKGQKINQAKLERAKEFRRNMTEAEKLLWNQLRRNQLGGFHFRRQQLIEGFIVDFYCDKAKLIVEVDGEIHNIVSQRDEERDSLLRIKGLRILRIRNAEIQTNISVVLNRILDSCVNDCAAKVSGYPTPE